MQRLTRLILFLLLPVISYAEKLPAAGPVDARVRHVNYSPRDVVHILGHYGYQTLIRFADYEEIENISIGDSLAWQVVPNERGNLLFLKPIEENAATNLTVVTSAPNAESASGVAQRIYVFSLRADSFDPHDSEKLTWSVQFHYPEDEFNLFNLRERSRSLSEHSIVGPGPSIDPTDWNFNYSFSGHQEQVPLKIFDNGTFTYFEFDERTDTPAIFLVDNNQNESLVNGVRQGKYVVVHRVGQQFTLRNGDVVTCIFNDAFAAGPRLDQGSPSNRDAAL